MSMNLNDAEMTNKIDSLSAEWASLVTTRQEQLDRAATNLNRAMDVLRETALVYRNLHQPMGIDIDYGLLAMTINELELLINEC